MKITETRELDLPDKFICQGGRSPCSALTDMNEEHQDYRLCAQFNRYVFWSDRAGFYVRCPDCINAHMNYIRGETT